MRSKHSRSSTTCPSSISLTLPTFATRAPPAKPIEAIIAVHNQHRKGTRRSEAGLISRLLTKGGWSSGGGARGVVWRRARTDEAPNLHVGLHRSRESYSDESSATDDQTVCGRGVGRALAGVR